MNTKLAILATAMFFLVGYSVSAQESTKVVEDVILFQSKSHLVRMTDKGKILAFLTDVDNNYSALNSVSSKEIVMDAVEISGAPDLGRVNIQDPQAVQLADIASQSSKVAQVEAVEEAMADVPASASEVEEEVISQEAISSMVEETATSIDEGSIAAVSEEMTSKGDPSSTNYDYEFAFDHRDASLSPAVVNQLNQVVKILEGNSEAKAEITSFFSETVDVSKILSKNRSKGIQDQLVASGIDRSRIKISEANNKDWANNRVQLSIY